MRRSHKSTAQKDGDLGTKGCIASAVQLSAITPLDPRLRREELRLAVLMVALVVSGMVDHGDEVGSSSVAGRRSPSGTAPVTRRSSRRHIRPPRSC